MPSKNWERDKPKQQASRKPQMPIGKAHWSAEIQGVPSQTRETSESGNV